MAGYDGSTASRRAPAWATGLARRTGRPLLAAYITPVPMSYDPGAVVVPVAEREADALVLGAPEHRLHHLIGSVPAWMARHAHCPVVIVP